MKPEHKKTLKALCLEIRHLFEGFRDADGSWQPGDLEQRLAALGVRRDRPAIPLDQLPHLSDRDPQARRAVDAYLEIRQEAGTPQSEAIGEFLRQTAYTWANRLLALRCMEARGLIDEVVLQKDVYGGRSLEHYRLAQKEPELCSGEDDGLFTVLERTFKCQAAHLPRLFDPQSPAILLRPSPAALKRVIRLLSGIETVNNQPPSDEIFEAPDALGWTYQYWNSEEKDWVFETLRTRKGAKIEGPDIIPATCIYTEPYIVKFLGQNSLGATWLGMYPDSKLPNKWEYFVRDADRLPAARKPVRDIAFLDPACGSGHFLLEAFDLFYEMYREEAALTDPQEICASILENNLYGIDIDERAVQIAEAALWMRAAERAPGFKGIPRNLLATNIHLPRGKDHLEAFMADHPDDEVLRPALETIFQALEHADELGSLLQLEEPVEKTLHDLEKKYAESQRRGGVQTHFFRPTAIQGKLPVGVENYEKWKGQVLNRLREHFEAEAVSEEFARFFFTRSAGRGLGLFDLMARRYDIVATNPPYMGSGNMGPVLKDYVATHYAPGKRDLYAAFILRCRELAKEGGRVSMVTQQSWMFLTSFVDLRAVEDKKLEKLAKGAFSGLLRETALETLAHLGPGAFSEVSGEVVSSVLFTLTNAPPPPNHRLTAFRLVGPKSAEEKDNLLRQAISNGASAISFKPRQARFLAIPEAPLSYWLSDTLLSVLALRPLQHSGQVLEGLHTENSARFVRYIWETTDNGRWLPYVKGGRYCKWDGLTMYAVDWEKNGCRIRSMDAVVPSSHMYFKEGLTYSMIARGSLGVRRLDRAIFTNSGPAVFGPRQLSCIMNCRISSYLLRCINSKLSFDKGYVERLPLPTIIPESLALMEETCVTLKPHLVALDPTERKFAHHSPSGGSLAEAWSRACDRQETVAAVLHALEGLSEREVFAAYGIAGDDLQAILDETGTPAGWFALIDSYDAIPELPVGLSVPGELLTPLAKEPRRKLSAEELAGVKHRLRARYEAGPGAKVEGEEEVTIDNGVEDEGKEAAVSGVRIPIPTETFLEELAQKLEVHPISVYWLIRKGVEREGWRCLPEEHRIMMDWSTVTILRLLSHRWPKQIKEGEPVADWADPDGIIPLTEGTGEATLLARVQERIAADFGGGNVAKIESEFLEMMGKPLEQWLETEFFKHHVSQFKKRPVAWQIQSGKYTARQKPAFACLVYYHKLDGDSLPKIRTQCVARVRQRYETELRGIETIPAETRTGKQEKRRIQLEQWIQELKDFDEKLEKVQLEAFRCPELKKLLEKEPIDKWCSLDGLRAVPANREEFLQQEERYFPDINDGVRVNIAPLQQADLLASHVLSTKDMKKAITDRAEWRSDERRWCREGKLPRPGWWPEMP